LHVSITATLHNDNQFRNEMNYSLLAVKL